MAKRKMIIPEYGTVIKKGVLYYRTRIKDADGKLVALYARTPEELYNMVMSCSRKHSLKIALARKRSGTQGNSPCIS